MRATIIMLVAVFTVGCATTPPPEMTRQEYLALVNRTYDGASAEEVLAATEKLFRLADPDDVKFQHFDNGLRVHRPWMIYVVLAATVGTDVWDVRVAPTQGGTRITVHLSTTTGSITGAPMTTSGGHTYTQAITTPPAGGIPVSSTAVYDLFWARLDYLLGRRDDWMTCEEVTARVKKGFVYGSTEALCSVTTDDLAPEGVAGAS